MTLIANVEGWSAAFADILSQQQLPFLNGNPIAIASDYSGDDSTGWWSICFVVIDYQSLLHGQDKLIDAICDQQLPRDFKGIRKFEHVLSAEKFLDIFNSATGHILCVGCQSKMENLSFKKDAAVDLYDRGVLSFKWGRKSFERLSRVCHILARHISVSIDPQCTIEWYSDLDEIIDNEAKKNDAYSIVNSLRRHYSENKAAKVLIESCKHESVNAFPKRICKIADLIAGAFNEKLRLSGAELQASSLGEISEVNVVPTGKIKERYETIDNWLLRNSPTLKKFQFVISETSDNKIRFHKFHQATL